MSTADTTPFAGITLFSEEDACKAYWEAISPQIIDPQLPGLVPSQKKEFSNLQICTMIRELDISGNEQETRCSAVHSIKEVANYEEHLVDGVMYSIYLQYSDGEFLLLQDFESKRRALEVFEKMKTILNATGCYMGELSHFAVTAKDRESEQSIPLWADICGMNKENLATQVLVHASELQETYEALLKGDKQEIIDGLVDVNWMCVLVDHISEGEVNLFPQFSALLDTVEGKYPGLIGEHFEPFRKAVLASNFSKFCTTPGQATLSIEKYYALGVSAYTEECEGYWAIISSKDQIDISGVHWPKGKIMKGIGYHKPNYVVE